jgi:F-type H+-transporting ATPase subunit alpha
MILILFAGMNGFVDNLPILSLGRYERDLYAFCDSRRTDLLPTIRQKCVDSKAFNELSDLMKGALTEFGKEFNPEAKA